MTMAKLLDADWLRGVQFVSCTAVQLMISKQTWYITAVQLMISKQTKVF